MTALDKAGLVALADRVSNLTRPDNAVDVLCEVALFKPTQTWVAVRANDAGTKVVYTDDLGDEQSFWADDLTGEGQREATAAALRAIAAGQP